jgi:asparagine synthase (glutamine-hydrolysing)
LETGYFGGIHRRAQLSGDTTATWPPFRDGWKSWLQGDLFVTTAGRSCSLFCWDTLALVIRGAIRTRSTQGRCELDRTAEEIRCHYLENGDLADSSLEGSFTLALLDGQAGRLLLYRNLVGAGFTYYHCCPSGLYFANNLTDLLNAVGTAPRVNHQALPTFFISRFVPGRQTLFDSYYRLLPGEQLTWDGDGFRRTQRDTFASFRADVVRESDSLEHLEATMNDVLGDCAARDADAINLLSGGVDSSYLQVVWNRLASAGNGMPDTYSISVDHPRTWPDTDYAMSASALLGTRHRLVAADRPYASYLLDLIATTGEPPNHVQSAYFGYLGRALVSEGKYTALCGEGADSLFGLGLANQLHNAKLVKSLVPFGIARRSAAALCRLLKRNGVANALWLADHMEFVTDVSHPINRAAVFTDWAAVEACFGPRSVQQALADRRSMLDHFQVSDDAMERLHAIGYLAEAIDSASLWTTLFNRAGADLYCPFLDSRMLRFVFNLQPAARFQFRRPKALLKAALVRNHMDALADKPKLGFGQPIFEWLGPGGQLRPLVEAISAYDFVDRRTLQSSLARPNWFLYSLLCFDLWHKMWIERSLPRIAGLEFGRPAAGPTVAATVANGTHGCHAAQSGKAT